MNTIHRYVLAIIVLALMLAACSTGTMSLDTPTSISTAIALGSPTATSIPSRTPTPTSSPTPTPSTMPTATPSPMPTLDPKAWEGVETNEEWTPVIHEFDGVPMALVPPGSFIMGTTLEQYDYIVELVGRIPGGITKERPAVRQTIEQAFWIDMTEVTNAQFAAFLNDQGNQTISIGSSNEYPWLGADNIYVYMQGDIWVIQEGHENFPVVEVNWYGADAFCRWRNARLPTELEWEYAGRGPDGFIYAWGKEYTRGAVADIFRDPARVGSGPYDVSWVGAWDMTGNAKEWVSTIRADYPYYADDGRETPMSQDIHSARVIRSFGYDHGASDITRLTGRGSSSPWGYGSLLSFRCAGDFDENEFQ